MSIYLWYLFIPYSILCLIITVLALFNLYHIIRFSFSNSVSTISTLIYLFGLLIIILVSTIAIVQYDWSQVIQINLSLNA